jgi:type I protein arginine methyltransferase
MNTILDDILRSTFRVIKKAIKSNYNLNNLIFDDHNVNEFTNIYEHERMIADAVRVNAYFNAINRYIKPNQVVLDLGTGTGILSFFAAQQHPRKIYAIDHSSFISIAKKIADHNGISNIEFIKANSRNFTCSEKVDVIMHEQLGNALFNENMLENLFDLKSRILDEKGIIFPSKFELYLEPVCLLNDYRIPYIWEDSVHGIDFSCLKNLNEIDQYKNADYWYRLLNGLNVDYLLCDPDPILSVDLNAINTIDDIQKKLNITKKIIRSGIMDGLLLYFKVIFDDSLSFDTAPYNTNTSWRNWLFRKELRNCQKDDTVAFSIDMSNLDKVESWKIDLN